MSKSKSIFPVQDFANSDYVSRLNEIANHYGLDSQLELLSGSCAGLIRAINKYQYFNGEATRSAKLIEELAGVLVSFIQVCHLLKDAGIESNTCKTFMGYVKSKVSQTEISISKEKSNPNNKKHTVESAEYKETTERALYTLIEVLKFIGAKYDRPFRLRYVSSNNVSDKEYYMERANNLIYTLQDNQMVSLTYTDALSLIDDILKNSAIVELGAYKPKYNEYYYYVSEHGEVRKRLYQNSYTDLFLVDCGNSFAVGDTISLPYVSQMAKEHTHIFAYRIVENFKKLYGECYTVRGTESD